MATVPLSVVHTIVYFTDALAPIWDVPVIEAQLLKKERVPTSPEVQQDIDQLVGQAVLLASNVKYTADSSGWHLEANYTLNDYFSDRIIEAMVDDKQQLREVQFVKEVVLALAGLGLPGIPRAAQADAAYGDPSIDVGNIIDLVLEDGTSNKTARVAQRFQELLGTDGNLSDAEVTHLYVRHLYSRISGEGG